MDQNHLGKFLKLSSIDFPVIEYQLFNFSKESLKQILLNSKCGEIINGKEFKEKPSNTDLIGTKNIYPLSCLYKKGKPKIKPLKGIYSWKNDKIKKKIDILSNSYMTLNILNLIDYYEKTIDNEKKRKEIIKFYLSCVKCQLNYYIDNFRNELGVFVNKKVIEDPSDNKDSKICFQIYSDSFDFPSQANLMICFYRCSNFMKETSPYKIPFLNFALEMEKMFVDFKEDILKSPKDKLVELLFSLSIYLKYVDSPGIINLSSKILENLINNYTLSSMSTYNKVLLHESMKNLKESLKDKKDFNIYKDIISEYLWDLFDMFGDENFMKNEIINEYDLISYMVYLLKYNKEVSKDFYENTFLPSKIFSCFPNIPKKYESEGYFKLNKKDEYKIPDKYFKPLSYKTMEETKVTPIICKDIEFNFEKNKFSKGKKKFDALINMRLIFLIMDSLKDIIIRSIK